MKFLKNKGGFTLVELLVVIAILGILAGIAIPTYSAYIKKADSAADTQVLSAIKTAVEAAYADKDSAAPSYIKVIDDEDDDKIQVSNGVSDYDDISGSILSDFNFYFSGGSATPFAVELKGGNTAVWNAGTWTVTTEVIPDNDND